MSQVSVNADLLAFLDSLRSRGWKIGIDQYVNAHRVALHILPSAGVPHLQMKMAISSVVCRTPQDQISFDEAFDRWWSASPASSTRGEDVPLHSSPPTRRVKRIWLRIAQALPLILIAVILAKAQEWLDPLVALLKEPLVHAALFGFFVVGTIAISLLLVASYRNRLVLRSAKFQSNLQQHLLQVQGVATLPGTRLIARQMRVQQVTGSYVLDIDRSIDATAREVGWFVPIIQPLRSTPEYLFLIEREAQHDHIAAYASNVAHQLRKSGVHLDMYEFRGDPRVIWHQGATATLSIETLAERHPAHRLIIVSDANALLDQVTTLVHPWADKLPTWPQRAVVTPAALNDWSSRRLEAHGFLLASLSLRGLEHLAERFNGQIATSLEDDSGVRMFYELRAAPWLWRDRRPPEREKVERLIDALRRNLTPSLFMWLKACAVYPTLQPELTRYLGERLGLQRLDSDFLALGRLPWFRRGVMPAWLRERLVVDMNHNEGRQVREALKALFLTAIRTDIDEGSLFALRLATVSSIVGGWAWKRLLSDLVATQQDDLLHDRVLVDFLRGRKLDRLTVAVPRRISALLGLQKRKKVSKKGGAATTFNKRRTTFPISVSILSFFGYLFIRALHATLRVRHVRPRDNDDQSQKIIAFWHECVLLSLHSRWRPPMMAIISRSRDGDIVAGVLRFYGAETARGSSTRGGGVALREVLRAAQAGISMGVTPDGPKGPRRVVKDGIVHIARISALPVVPFYFTAQKQKRLRSWDRGIVPLPFSKALFLYGPPIQVPRDGDVEEWRLKIEQEMNDMADEAERNFDALWASGEK